ncbi:MAG: copper-binding protein [Geminicoccaceae bacterium]|nr:copper-binding protein [Geminicoccaceae bacterium]
MPAQAMRRWAGGGSAVALLFAAVATGDAQDFAFGSAGDPASATRTVELVMKDNYFEPEAVEVQAGETVRFALTNEGELLHQFTLGPVDFHRNPPVKAAGQAAAGRG